MPPIAHIVENNRLIVWDAKDGNSLYADGIQGFETKYRVYRDLRSRGLVVTPGIKYGCDFAVYQHGPGVDHAPYIVQVWINGDLIDAAEVVKTGRLATTVRKSFI